MTSHHVLCVWGAILAIALSPAPTSAQVNHWQIEVVAQDEAASNTLPILRLDRGDWVGKQDTANKTAHAWRAIQLETLAHHPSGWTFGAITRAQASLHASPDAVQLAALSQQQLDPQMNTSFATDVRYQFWQGRGLSTQTPAWRLPIATPWTLSAKLQALQLTHLRTRQLAGVVAYQGAGSYDFDLRAHRLDSALAPAFGAAPEPQGWGGSLSLDLKGKLDGLDVRVQASDVISILKWQLTQDTSKLQSANTTRNPDGTLHYAPLITGQQRSVSATERMDTDWRISLGFPAYPTPTWLPRGHLTADAQRHSQLNQWWMGWKTQSIHLAIEPNVGAVRLKWAASGWFVDVATNRLDTSATLRNWQLGWRGAI